MSIKDQYLTAKEAGEYLGYSANHMRNLADANAIFAVRRGHAWFFKKEDLDAFLIPNSAKIDAANEQVEEEVTDEINIG